MRIMLAFEDNSLINQEKIMVLLEVLYKTFPDNIEQAVVQGIKFLNGGKERGEDSGPRVFSLSTDAELIFSAFRQTHSIDLETAHLHWWKFLALFMDLGSDTAFCSLINLRRRVKTGKATNEERQAAREIGDLFDVPEIDTRTLEEKAREEEFLRLVRSRGK